MSTSTPLPGKSPLEILLLDIQARLSRIEQKLGIPPLPRCDEEDCSNIATTNVTSGMPPVTRRWCPEHSPGMRNLTAGLTSPV